MALRGGFMDERQLTKQREYNVTKSNVLIQEARYNLSVQEQKLVLRLIQMIQPDDTEFKLYEFKIKDFCEICGIENNNGKNYINIKKTLKSLADKSYWFIIDDGRETPLRWIERPYIDRGSGTIQIKLDELMKPYLLKLKEFYTSYSLYNVISMRSKYAIRLYELLKSYQNLKEKNLDIEKLKVQLLAEKYSRWVDLKRFVIEPALKEINLLSDIYVTYSLEKQGRQYKFILFRINNKEDVDEKIKAWNEIEQRLNPKRIKNQLSLFFENEVIK